MPDPDRSIELRILRERTGAMQREADRLSLAHAPRRAAPMLVQVYAQAAVPTSEGKYYACHPVTPGGAEVEGGAGTFDPSTATVFVLVTGSRVPVAGDYLIARAIAGRWVAEGRSGPRCDTGVTIRRTNQCFPAGATITATRQDTGEVVFSGPAVDTGAGTLGGVSFRAVPGKLYTINWAYFELSGSFTVAACSGGGVDIATPPGHHLTTNCVDAMPTIYVTDLMGTREVWPGTICVNSFTLPVLGIPFDWRFSLQPAGTCAAPTWVLGYSQFVIAGSNCTSPQALPGAPGTPIPVGCTRPFSYSGTYAVGGHMQTQPFTLFE